MDPPMEKVCSETDLGDSRLKKRLPLDHQYTCHVASSRTLKQLVVVYRERNGMKSEVSIFVRVVGRCAQSRYEKREANLSVNLDSSHTYAKHVAINMNQSPITNNTPNPNILATSIKQ